MTNRPRRTTTLISPTGLGEHFAILRKWDLTEWTKKRGSQELFERRWFKLRWNKPALDDRRSGEKMHYRICQQSLFVNGESLVRDRLDCDGVFRRQRVWSKQGDFTMAEGRDRKRKPMRRIRLKKDKTTDLAIWDRDWICPFLCALDKNEYDLFCLLSLVKSEGA